ncbi:multimerin-2-like [Odontesthes bonariensis]|uniref:multimerin-2-like n=1 Tax=Odontesthes bonariensis TaxID=219752 RepID=UPI003F586892
MGLSPAEETGAGPPPSPPSHPAPPPLKAAGGRAGPPEDHRADMRAVGELVLVLGLLVSAHCEVRARDPEVEEEGELGGGAEARGIQHHPGVTETPLEGQKGNYPARSGSKLSTRSVYGHDQNILSCLLWRCCPGHLGKHCEDAVSEHQPESAGSEPKRTQVQAADVRARPQRQQHVDPHREQNDHQGPVDTYQVQPDVYASAAHHPPHTTPKMDHRDRVYPDEVDATAPTATNSPTLRAMMELVMAQLKPLLDGFNRSLEHLNQQVGQLAGDVAQLRSSRLGAERQAGPLEEPLDEPLDEPLEEPLEERLDTKLDVVFQQIGEVQRQMEVQRTYVENRLQSQHATLHYNLTTFKMDVDMKLKHHQKMMQVSLQAMNATLAEVRLNQDQVPDEDLDPASLLPPQPPADMAAVWDAIARLDNTVVNNTVKVGGLTEDSEVTSGGVQQLKLHLKELEKQINQTARNSQILFMETGLEVEDAKVSVQRRVEEVAAVLAQHELRLQEMDVDVDYLYTVLYKHNSSTDCDCKALKAAVAELERGVANVTELANENKMALDENSLGGAGPWGGAGDWEPAVEALQRGLQQVRESLVSERSRTRTLELNVTHLGDSVSGLQKTSSKQEEQLKPLFSSFPSLFEDTIRHSEVLQLLLGEEVMEFREWPQQDQEAYSITTLKEQIRQLGGHDRGVMSQLGSGTGGREEVPSADQPSFHPFPDWLPGGVRRTGGGAPAAREHQLLLLQPDGRQHAGDGSDLWNLEKMVEEQEQRLGRLEERPCSCNATRGAPPAGLEAKLQKEVTRLRRGLEEHLRVFKNVFGNADVLAASNATLELDKLWQLMEKKEKKRGGRGRGGRSHRRRRESAGGPVPFDQSDASLLFVAGSPRSVPGGGVAFQPLLNRGRFDGAAFTAPVGGIYVFVLTLDLRPGSAHLVLRRGGGGAPVSLQRREVTEAGPVTGVGLLPLREGEELRLELRGGEWAESEDNVFAGLLLHRTT